MFYDLLWRLGFYNERDTREHGAHQLKEKVPDWQEDPEGHTKQRLQAVHQDQREYPSSWQARKKADTILSGWEREAPDAPDARVRESASGVERKREIKS